MKLESQVISLDLAKRLKALGVKQESCFYWIDVGMQRGYELADHRNRGHDDEYIAAFTVAELGEMLPCEIHNAQSTDHPVHRFISEKTTQDMKGTQVEGWHAFYICKTCKGRLGSQWSVEEAEARGLMLEYLITNKLLAV